MSRTALLTLLTVAAALPLAAAAGVPAQDDAYPLAEGAPSLGRSAIVRVVEGTVYFREPGRFRYRRLPARKSKAIPMAAYLDARRGSVRVTVMRAPHTERTASAVFSEGKFQITQQRSSPYVTDLRLVGSYTEACRAAASRATASAKRKRRRVRRLWGDGKGRFRTSGRYSAATVRGTRWLVEDRCDGTLTRVARGVVDVEDYSDVPEPAPQSSPGSPEAGAPAPAGGQADRPAKRVRLRRGARYVARPRD